MSLCLCNHLRSDHEHHTRASDTRCGASVPIGVDGYGQYRQLLEHRCECQKFRSENVQVAVAAALIVVGIFMAFGVIAMVR